MTDHLWVENNQKKMLGLCAVLTQIINRKFSFQNKFVLMKNKAFHGKTLLNFLYLLI